MVLGDWGGWPAPHYSSPIQKSVADSMGRTSRLHRPEYIVGLGDNFYYHGVEDENDPMFENTFENIYSGPTDSRRKSINNATDYHLRVSSANLEKRLICTVHGIIQLETMIGQHELMKTGILSVVT